MEKAHAQASRAAREEQQIAEQAAREAQESAEPAGACRWTVVQLLTQSAEPAGACLWTVVQLLTPSAEPEELPEALLHKRLLGNQYRERVRAAGGQVLYREQQQKAREELPEALLHK